MIYCVNTYVTDTQGALLLYLIQYYNFCGFVVDIAHTNKEPKIKCKFMKMTNHSWTQCHQIFCDFSDCKI